MRAHPAGPLHAGFLAPPETAGPRPGTAAELDVLAPAVWPRHAVRGASGSVEIAGVDVRDLAEAYGTPLFVIDEADFRARAHAFAAAFGPSSVHYAAKAFLCTEVARWVAEEGLALDVCSGGELAIALARGVPGRADHVARQQQVARRARRGRGGGRRTRGARLVPRDRPAGRDRPRAGRRRGRDGAPDGGRRGAHPRVHGHRARGPEVRLRAAGRRRSGAARAEVRGAVAGGAAQPHRQPDLRHRRVRGGRPPRGAVPRRAAPRARGRRAHRPHHARPRRRVRHRLPGRRDAARRPAAGRGAPRHRETRVPRRRPGRARRSPSSPGGRSPGPAPSRCTRWAR